MADRAGQEGGRKSPPDWDAHYASVAAGLYGEEPNEYLRMVWARSDFAAREILMLGDGDGRNGTWLARQGARVTAVDLSRVASEKARARDRAAGVEATRIVADLARWSPPAEARWDAVVALYVHCAREVRARAFKAAIAALKPGGWFVVEAFAKTRGERLGIGLADQELRYDIAELEGLTGGLEMVEAFAGRTVLDEGAIHHGMAEVVRFAARRLGVT